MDELWDRVARLTGCLVALPGMRGHRLLIAEVQANVVLVQPEVLQSRGRLLQEPPLRRIPREDIEVAAGLVQLGVPLTVASVRTYLVQNRGAALEYPGYVVAIVRAALEEPPAD